MIFDAEEETWSIPSVKNVSGQVCADAAVGATRKVTGCKSEVVRYQKKLKSTFDVNGREFLWQPYIVNIEGEPREGEWVSLSEIDSMQLDHHLENIKDKLVELESVPSGLLS